MSYRVNRLHSASQRRVHLPFQNKGTGAQRGGLTCLRPPKRAMAQPVIHWALSSAPALHPWPALILPHWSELPLLECPYSCLRLCPIEIREHFSWGHISAPLKYFCYTTLLHNICPPKDAFFLLLSFAFSCILKEATFMSQSKNLFSQALQIYSDHELTMGLIQFSSYLPSMLFTQKHTVRHGLEQTSRVLWRGKVQIWSPSSSKPAQAHVYAVGRCRSWTRALYWQTFRADILCGLPLKSGKGK